MTNSRNYPTPFYAAAGAGEAIVEELKKLPNRMEELRDRTKLDERAQTVRDNVKQGVASLRKLDADRVRSAAEDTAATLGVKAREARERASQTYSDLVERGQHVANGERSPIKVIATIASGETTAKTNQANGSRAANGSAKTSANGSAKAAASKPAAKKTTRKPVTKTVNGKSTGGKTKAAK